MSLAAVLVHYGPQEPSMRTVNLLCSCPVVQQTVVVCHSAYSGTIDPRRGVRLEEENKGYAAGINLAVRYLAELAPQVDRVLAVNADVDLDCRSVEELDRAHVTSGADCTFPSIRERDRLIQGYRFTSFGTMKLASGNAHFFSGTCFVFALRAWEKVGGLDESYFHYYEDLDFCLRLSRAGFRLHHAPEIIIDHAGKSGVEYPSTPLPRLAVRNHLRFLRKLGDVGPLAVTNVALRHLLYLFRWPRGYRGLSSWARGVREYLADNGS